MKRNIRIVEDLDEQLQNDIMDEFIGNKHNKNQFKPNECFRIARSLSTVGIRNAELLIIGPRNFSELLLAFLNGFSWKRIAAVDLFSEFYKIKLGKIEKLPFSSDSFDVVVCSGVLNYVKPSNLELAMKNLVMVTKNNGLIILQVDCPIETNVERPSSWSLEIEIDEKVTLVNEVVEVLYRESIYREKAVHEFRALRVCKK